MVQPVHPVQQAGFVLPLAISGALVLLLSSLSLQSLVLHTRQVQAAERNRLQAEDRLASAAMRLAADFQARLACLKPLPLDQWRAQALPATCPSGLDPEAAQRLWIDGEQVQLAGWSPQLEGGSLQLQMADGGFTRRYWIGPSGVKELG